MTSQSNQYADLLKYLEAELSIKDTIKKTNSLTLDKASNIPVVKNPLEGIYSDVTQKIPNATSRGFDVNKFESLMREKLVADHKKIQDYERPYISVTELFTCLRQKYYVRKKYKIDIKKQFDFSYLLMINEVGNTIHSLIQKLYDHTEIEKTIISKKYNVKGRVDGIKNNFILEYKTIDESKFEGNYIATHYYQGLIYANILNSEYNYKIDTITIVYITRNLKRIIPFDLPIDDDKAIQFLKVAPIFKKCLDENKVPEPLNSDEEQCKWCQYKIYCDKENILPNPTKKINSIFLL